MSGKPEQATCRSCGAAIIWVKMKNTGKANPVDAEPSDKGNLEISNGEGVVLSKSGAVGFRAAGGKLHLSHFATCPDRAAHRKKAP